MALSSRKRLNYLVLQVIRKTYLEVLKWRSNLNSKASAILMLVKSLFCQSINKWIFNHLKISRPRHRFSIVTHHLPKKIIITPLMSLVSLKISVRNWETTSERKLTNWDKKWVLNKGLLENSLRGYNLRHPNQMSEKRRPCKRLKKSKLNSRRVERLKKKKRCNYSEHLTSMIQRVKGPLHRKYCRHMISLAHSHKNIFHRHMG